MYRPLNLGWTRRLKNDEHPFMVGLMCDVLDHHEIADENVAIAASRLKSHLDKLELVKIRSMKDKFTPILRKLHKERKQSIVSLQAQIRAFVISPIESQKNDGELLSLWMSKHQGKLLRLGYVSLTKRIQQIVDEAESEQNVKQALENQKLTVLIQKLMSQNEEFYENFTKRLNIKSQKKKVDVFAIRENADSDLRLLMNTLVITNYISENQNKYQVLLSRLNEILKYYKTIVKIRNSKASNKAETQTEKMPQMELEKGLAEG